MKKSVYILLLIVFSLTSKAQQENNLDRGIYESYAIFTKNGSGNIYYDLQRQTGNPDFSGANLGTFGANCSLILNGGLAKTYTCNGCNITGSTLFYSIYPATGSPNFNKSIVLNFYSNALGGCGGNQTWESIGHNDNILAGLSPGAYKIAIYIQTTFDSCGNGSLFASNNGNNYIADFTVLAPPTLQASASVCLGSSVTLTGSCINATPKWSTGEERTMISVSPIINTTYTATCKTSDGCESATSSSVTVTVNSLSVTNHPITQFDCEPNSVRFLATASTTSTGIGSTITYQWQRKLPSEASFTALTNASPTAFSGNSLQVSPTGGTNISGTQFRYIATDGNGCPITSNPAILYLNNVGTISNTAICENTDYSLTVPIASDIIANVVSYQWEVSDGTTWGSVVNGGGISGATTQTLNFTSIPFTQDGKKYRCRVVFNVSANNDNDGSINQGAATTCPRTSAEVTLNVRQLPPVPTINTTSPQTKCLGESVTLNSTGCAGVGGTTSWYENGVVVSSNAIYTFIPSAVSSKTYKAVCTKNGCESAFSSDVVVNVNPVPVAPSVTINPASAVVCQGNAVALTMAKELTTNKVRWYNQAIAGTSVSSSSATTTSSHTYNVPIADILPANATTPGVLNYWVEQENTFSCKSTRTQTSFTVNPSPSSPTVTSPVNYCQNATTNSLIATAIGSNDLLWYGTSTTGGVSSATTPVPTSTNLGTMTYYVSQKNSYACESARASISVVINAIPDAPSATTAVAYCKNSTAIALSATAVGSNNLIWYDENDNILRTAPTPNTSIAGIQIFKVSQKSPEPANCESAKTTITVTINDLPSTPTVATPVVYCQNSTVSALSATSIGTNTLLWYGTNAVGGTSSGAAPSPLTSSTGTTSYFVSQKDANNCESLRAKIDVVVTPSVSASISGTNAFCITGVLNSSTILTANPTGGNGSYSYQWQNLAGNIATATSQTLTVNSTVQSANSDTYRITIMSGNCTATAAITVTKQGWSDIPNVSVSPIGDICESGIKTLNINSPSAFGVYKWFIDASTLTQTQTGTSFATPNLTSTTTYYVAREQQSTAILTCQTERTAIVINVNAIPETPTIANSANKTTFCNSESGFNLSISCISGSAKYRLNNGSWTNGSLVSISPSTYNSSTILNYDFRCSLNTNCESGLASTSITINPVPNAPTVAGNTSICFGASTTLTASGCLGVVIWNTGATSSTLNVSTSGTYNATCVLNDCVSAVSQTKVVSINSIPIAPTISGNSSFCVGGSTTLTANGCSGMITWSTGTTGSILSVSSAGTYSATCTENLCISAESLIQTVSINPLPTISLETIDNICNTATTFGISYTVTTNAPDKFSLTSIMPDFITITEEILPVSPILVTIPPARTGIQNFTLNIKNSTTGCNSTQTFSVTILPALAGGSIELSSSGINCSGYNAGAISNVSLASGGKADYVYQWQSSTDNQNFIDISGANTTTFDPPALTETTYYRRKVTDACGTNAVSSNVYQIQVVPDPQITITDAAERTICSGGNISLDATVIGGSGMCTPTWQSSLTPSGTYTNEQVGGLSFTKVLTNNTTATIIKYYRAIYGCSGTGSGSCNQGVSSVVKVTVNPVPNTPIITPASVVICPNQSAILTASGCIGIVTWNGGQTGSTLSVSEAGSYSANCMLSSCISTTSSLATVTLASGGTPVDPPIISGTATICNGQSTTLTATNCSGLVTWSDGTTGAIINVSPSISVDYTATCFDGTCTSNNSNKITITVNSYPTITTQPKNEADCNGNSVIFRVIATSVTTYQWKRKIPNGTFTDIAAATSNALTISDVGSASDPNMTEYRVVVSNAVCSLTSTVAVLTVNSVEGSLVDQTICDGANTSFNLSDMTISGNIQGYQWQRRIGTSGTWNDIADATATTFTINAATNADEQYYRCKVNFSTGGSTTCARYTTEDDSNGAKLNVLIASKPNILGTNVICLGRSTTLTANNCEGIIAWSSGQSTATISVSPTNNTSYTVSCTSTQCGFNVSSAPLLVTVNSTPQPEIITYDVITPATLTFAARTTVPNATLMWYNRVSGGTGTTTAPSFSAVGTYSYWVTQTDPISGCESVRLPIIAKILNYFHITQQPLNQVDCRGNSVYFGVVAVGSKAEFTYQWQRKRPNDPDFVNLVEDGKGIRGWYAKAMAVSNVGDVNNPDQTQYRCIIGNNGQFLTSEISTLTVNSLVGSMPNLGICVGATNEFNLQNYFTITGNVMSYQWQTRPGTGGAWTNLTDGNGIVGSSTSILKFTKATYEQGVYYRCLVKFNTQGFECTEPTDAAKLIVSGFPPAPSVSSVFYCQNANAVKLKVDSPIQNLVWYTQEVGGSGFRTAPTPNTSIAGVFKYYVSDRTDEGCEGARAVINVSVGALPPAPKNTTLSPIYEGNTLTFSAEGTPVENQVLRWYTTPTTSTFSTVAPVFTAAGIYTRYVAQVSAFGCVGQRTAITATIIPSLKFTKQPTSEADCDGNSVTFRVTATAPSAFTYQWQRQRPNETSFIDLANETSNSLKISNIGNAENPNLTKYRCIIKDDKNTVISEEVILTVNQIVGKLATMSLCDGNVSKLSFSSLSITGNVVMYQWQKKTGSTYTDIPTNANGIAIINEIGTYRGRISFLIDKTTTCNRSTEDLKVELKPSPAAPKVTNQFVCQNTVFDITRAISATNSLLWYDSATDTTADKTTPKIDITELNKTTYYVSQITPFGCESERKSFNIEVSAIPEKPIVSDIAYCRNAPSLALTATTLPQNKVVWYAALTAKDAFRQTPIPDTKTDGEIIYFAATQNLASCESERLPLKVSISPCIANFGNNFNNCLQVSADSVKGNKWFDLHDNSGRIYASVNPNGLNLGKVSTSIRHYGRGSSAIPATKNDTKLMARYVDFQSSLLNEFPTDVSLRIYYLNEELNEYKTSTNLPNLTINDFNILHYDGIREDCGFENNDNFSEGDSYVIYKNVIGNQIAKDFFYLQFDVNKFSENGATANDFTEISFSGKEIETQSVQLNWQSHYEIKADKYILERSEDCKNFVKIGEIKANGSASTYESVDYQPFAGKNCYRLVYIDKDGTKKYLDAIEANFTNTAPTCSVFPNPWTKGDEINLYLRNIKAKTIKLYDMSGKDLSFSASKNESKIITIHPDVHLTKGIHFVVITGEDNKKCVQKVVVNP